MSRANLVILIADPAGSPGSPGLTLIRNVDLRLATAWMQGFNAAEQQMPCGTLATLQVCPASGTARTIESPGLRSASLSRG